MEKGLNSFFKKSILKKEVAMRVKKKKKGCVLMKTSITSKKFEVTTQIPLETT